MATKVNTDGFFDLHFPKCGLDVSGPLAKQPARQMANGQYGRTTPVGVNVQTFEPGQNRDRGGSRQGLSKFVPEAIEPGWLVQGLNTIVSMGNAVETNQFGRVVTAVGVSKGNVSIAQSGDEEWTDTVNGTASIPPLNTSGLVFSATFNQQTFFFDGSHNVYYDPGNNTVLPWVAANGTVPIDSGNNTPRMGCVCNGRLFVSGLLEDPQNWFASRQGNAFDWNYGSDFNDAQQAVAGNNGPAGMCGDVITALIPYDNDTLIFGQDHTISILNGDPMAGGRIDLVSDAIGIAFGAAWCKDPYGALYFYSSRNQVYRMVPGQSLQVVSNPIQHLLDDIDTGSNSIHMAWDVRFQGFHLWITPLSRNAQNRPQAATHYLWEMRSGSWFQKEHANNYHNPLCSCVFDGNSLEDRVILTGSWNGFVMKIDPAAETDDGTPIRSSVVLGPWLTDNLDEMMLESLQAILGASSGEVTYEVLVGETAEQAILTEPIDSGVWTAGRNPTEFIRRSAYAVYLRLTSTNRWMMESIRAGIRTLGTVRGRGRNQVKQ
jgi:hypothetical protein